MAKKKAKTSAKTRHPLAQAPLDELAAELSRRRAALPKLVERRRKLQQEIAELDQQIEMLEGLDGGSGGRSGSGGSGTRTKSTTKKKSAAGGTTRRGRGGGPTMRDKIGEVLGGDPMRPVEIARALVDRGLHQGGKSLHIQVSTVLAKFDEFKNVARGQWVRKDG
ncbi:MAG: hypothetical protein VX726_00140 [Planctomycetota bacterium]|nr:hypothetical protein [Planctomycetota bacterium]